jgi:hypothetical protein
MSTLFFIFITFLNASFIVYFNSSIVRLLFSSITCSYSAHLFGHKMSGMHYVSVVLRCFAYLRMPPVVQGHVVDRGCDFYRPIESSVVLPLCSGLLVEQHCLVKDIFVYQRFLNSTSPVHGSIVVGIYGSITWRWLLVVVAWHVTWILRNYSSNILIGLRY